MRPRALFGCALRLLASATSKVPFRLVVEFEFEPDSIVDLSQIGHRKYFELYWWHWGWPTASGGRCMPSARNLSSSRNGTSLGAILGPSGLPQPPGDRRW